MILLLGRPGRTNVFISGPAPRRNWKLKNFYARANVLMNGVGSAGPLFLNLRSGPEEAYIFTDN